MVVMALAVRAGTMDLGAFVTELRDEVLFLQRTEHPGVFIAELEDGERWVSAFSTPEAMAEFTGGVEWVSLRGDDLMDLVPVGTNVVLDPSTPHSVAIESIDLPKPLLEADDQSAPRSTAAEDVREGDERGRLDGC
ncbi:SseB family protein [Saccharopolyspora sp. CA-218241]|uniref:SseB family protein n=1 Tax=Saccharopolyspora sp. CA-218241 TaxID=3240027 RepID=UPI003D9563CC